MESILITGGAAPGSTARIALVDPGDAVVYPVPWWNNNHYVYLTGARAMPIPDAADELPPQRGPRRDRSNARLLVLNSPLNPTGTAIDPRCCGHL